MVVKPGIIGFRRPVVNLRQGEPVIYTWRCRRGVPPGHHRMTLCSRGNWQFNIADHTHSCQRFIQIRLFQRPFCECSGCSGQDTGQWVPVLSLATSGLCVHNTGYNIKGKYVDTLCAANNGSHQRKIRIIRNESATLSCFTRWAAYAVLQHMH